jgi:hypothetical protein
MLVFELVTFVAYTFIATLREWVVTSPTMASSSLELSFLFELAMIGFIMQAFFFTLVRMR